MMLVYRLSPTMTSHKPLDYQNTLSAQQWDVWVPFHFLPGNDPAEGAFIERMKCRADSDAAQRMLHEVLDARNADFWPHWVGIAAHVYADTFSHDGFAGLADPGNKVKKDSIDLDVKSPGILSYLRSKFEEFKSRCVSDFAELVPVGHGAVGTFPDRPYLKWSFEYEGEGGPARRDNPKSFLAACEGLHSFFTNFASVAPQGCQAAGGRDWGAIAPVVQSIVSEENPMEERIKSWLEKFHAAEFCTLQPEDQEVGYEEGLWQTMRALSDSADLHDSNACKFMRAARRHRDYVLFELLPELKLTLF